MTKKLLSVFLVFVLAIAIAPVSVFAENDVEIYLTSEIRDGEAIITGCDKSISGTVVIPDTIKGCPVTIIGDGAFMECRGLTEVILPDSVRSLGEGSFYECTGLERIMLPADLTNVEEIAFINCTNLKEVILPDGVTIIESGVFKGCCSLTEVIIPDGVTGIGAYAFEGCCSLTEVIIPDGVTVIEEFAFADCTSLESIILPEREVAIAEGAFSNTAYCNNDENWESKLLYIGKHLIAAKDDIVECKVKDGTLTIGCKTFFNCNSLAEITLPDSKILCFDSEFSNTAYYNDETNWENKALYIGKHLIAAKNDITECDVKDGTITICTTAFMGCSELSDVKLPASLIDIGESAFMHCTSLKEVMIPDSVISVGEYAFGFCSRLKKVILPDTLTELGRCAFFWCPGLEEITIPSCLTEISDSVFSNCASLTDATIPDGVTSIGCTAFLYCESLTEITIPDSVTTVGINAFYCSGLKSVTIPDSVTEIGEHAFGYYSDSKTDEAELADGFTIYGYVGSAAEKYAAENGIRFIALKDEDSSSDNENSDTQSGLDVRDDSVVVDEYENTAIIESNQTAEHFAEKIGNASFRILSKNGVTLDSTALVGTGAKIQIYDNEGKTVNEYTVIVPADVDGNGKTTAADARLALRCSAALQVLEGVYSIASDCNSDGKITAADARKILRKSAGLE